LTTTPTVPLVCLYGSANSLIALEHFRRLAQQRGVDVQADWAGIEPDAEIPPRVVFTKACELFEKASALEPGNGHSYGLWALALYDWGRYAKAWEKVQKAQELRTAIPETFLRRLREKMPEPKRP
jgi:tetratricopeptide (TPR) repeat protein